MSALLKEDAIGDFSRVTVSVYALASSSLLNIIEQDTELQTLAAELQKETQNMQGDVAKANGLAQQNVAQQNADYTRSNAYGLIVQGGLSGGMTLIGTPLATNRYEAWFTNSSGVNTELDNVSKWDAKLEEPGASVGAAGAGSRLAGPEFDEEMARGVLQDIDVKTDPTPRSQKNIVQEDALSAAKTASSPEKYGEDFDALKEKVKTEQKDLRKQKEAIDSQVQNFRSKLDTIAASIASIGQASYQIQAAAAQVRQGQYSNLQTQVQFASDSSKQSVDATASYFSKLDDAKQSAIRTLGEIAANNRV